MRKLLTLLLAAVHFFVLAAPPEAVRQAEALHAVLQQADDAYYNQNKPVMSNEAYDALRKQYDRLIADWPELAAPETVGSPPDRNNRAVHPEPILSLKKVYSDDALHGFLEQTGISQRYCVEPKIDGLTVVIHYKNGLLTRAVTRGDGKTGVDITPALLASGALPAQLADAPSRLIVRGEAFLPFQAFDQLNRRRTGNGLDPLKTPRSAAAGTLMLTDYAEISKRGLSVKLFELLDADTLPATHSESMEYLWKLGLPTVTARTVSGSDVIRTVEQVNRQRADFPFLTDGIVIKLDDRNRAIELGATAHHPHSAVARKYRPVPAETRLIDVEWSRGETGRLTPVAVFEPVELQGATVQRASLYSLNHLRALGLKIGDRISVIRAGGAVPEITGVLKEHRTGAESDIPNPGI